MAGSGTSSGRVRATSFWDTQPGFLEMVTGWWVESVAEAEIIRWAQSILEIGNTVLNMDMELKLLQKA